MVDALGNPVKLLFTGGNLSDGSVAVEWLPQGNIHSGVMMGERADGTAAIREPITKKGSAYDLQIEDEDILSAISCHTIGEPAYSQKTPEIKYDPAVGG